MVIPAPLVQAAALQQLIPFVGAGMSASLGLPLSVSSWSGPTRARLLWPQAEVGQRRHRLNHRRRLGGATGQRSTWRGMVGGNAWRSPAASSSPRCAHPAARSSLVQPVS